MAPAEAVSLFGGAMVATPDGSTGPSNSTGAPALGRMRAWRSAFDLWLASRPSPNTRRVYRAAWEQFVEFTDCLPWEVGGADISRWVDHLRNRGLSEATIHQRLAAVSSFYSYTNAIYTRPGLDGKLHPLHEVNPAAGVARPKTSPFGHARCLSAEEARAFLKAIPRNTVQGKRDYALFLTYLATGRRNSEIRTLRWEDIEGERLLLRSSVRGGGEIGKTFYRWRGKGKSRLDELPGTAWEAVVDFLGSAGRLKAMQPGDYLFTALSDCAARLPNVSLEEWHRNRPLSPRETGRLLKKYARLAGLEARRVTVHTLRHTAAMLRRQAGDDIEQISAFLGHSSLAVTQVYLHTLEGQQDTSWAKVSALLGLSP